MASLNRLLVANRGEIACRVMRTCRALGIETVAVYSEADREAAHVAMADQACAIGPSRASESYLRQDAILQAAAQAGAQAVHPGYGFLSENASFAQAVLQAGLTWIGPRPDSIRDMGDKQRARELAVAAGVPVVPGSERYEAGALDGMAESAARVGYPLLVKAVAGGGGIGMRRVDKPEDLMAVVEASQSMAAKAFGNGAVFLERYIPLARHVEIQVFGFGDGNAIHLYERDCSLQRRYQKIIEESPAPGLPAATRARMAQAAVDLCRATRYQGAGTVEFIVDAASFEFYFLEMNTRIQVEHPVTEMITGRDLVAMQIDLARGQLPALAQDEIATRGHAIECRLYAEDPKRMFMPSPGRLAVFRPPADLPGVRVDSGYREGDEITPFYDPMVAKLIAHGDDRDTARRIAADALRQFAVEGIRHNRDFLIACLEHPDFAAGDVHTGFVESHRQALC
ncbi:acetyl-CoA carboxylase [Bordetella sp. H567]|uniref:acetyl-CoA carboxylase biotin carboxylase subunit n=1 Tax=Bordetella sp. H567 TaxID=1697043 RepID=UPI00081CBC32|nr:biotin carboxylase N-terminal domain-containing protein [Bordetella sp. H567]AOB30094.1 acetyl-CoA carboxylase [Bordetella sp. H567]